MHCLRFISSKVSHYSSNVLLAADTTHCIVSIDGNFRAFVKYRYKGKFEYYTVASASNSELTINGIL